MATGYESLERVLKSAHDQAAYGKGRERHGSALAFEDQPICRITQKVGIGFPLGQTVKKIFEARKMLDTHKWDAERASQELLGAIVYLAAAVHFLLAEEDEADRE